MKTKLFLTGALVALLTVPVLAQTNTPPATNDFTEVISIIKDVASGSNVMVMAYGIYDVDTKTAGAGVGAVYNVTDYVGTSVRLDYINHELWRPSGSAQLQYPITVGKTTLIPFLFVGMAIPVGGHGSGNGTPSLIDGAGLAWRLAKRWDLIGDYESWSGDTQIRFGGLYKF